MQNVVLWKAILVVVSWSSITELGILKANILQHALRCEIRRTLRVKAASSLLFLARAARPPAPLLPLVCQISFVPHQHDDDVASPLCPNIINPLGGLLEGIQVCKEEANGNVKDKTTLKRERKPTNLGMPASRCSKSPHIAHKWPTNRFLPEHKNPQGQGDVSTVNHLYTELEGAVLLTCRISNNETLKITHL